MKIKEAIRKQSSTSETHIYLLAQGAFYHAYNEGAEHLYAITGFKIRDMKLSDGTKYKMCGFPISALTCVYGKIVAYYKDRFVTVEKIEKSHLVVRIIS